MSPIIKRADLRGSSFLISTAKTARLSGYGSQVTVSVSGVIVRHSTPFFPLLFSAYLSLLLNQPTTFSPPVWAFWRFFGLLSSNRFSIVALFNKLILPKTVVMSQ